MHVLRQPRAHRGAARVHLRCTFCGGRDHDIFACPKTFNGNGARTWHEDDVADHFVKDKL